MLPRSDEMYEMVATLPLGELCRWAAEVCQLGHGDLVTYSRRVFVPLTSLCQDFCHYGAFATVPKRHASAYLSADEAVSLALHGQALGCKEVLFTLGEKPELHYQAAREALHQLCFGTTLEYVAHVAGRVMHETGLLPHINAGCMTPDEISMLRKVSVSMGIMLENVSTRLCEKGQVHYGSHDKHPAARMQTLEDAGKAGVPFTTGILVGVGETWNEQLDSLLAIRDLHQQYGHIQEIIIQNFATKADTKTARVAPPADEDFLRTLAVARLVFGPSMSIQAPPSLNPGKLTQLLNSGVNDWGGISPLILDHVNPKSPWPHLNDLASDTRSAGRLLQERLTVYPQYVSEPERWLDDEVRPFVFKLADGAGLAREDHWLSGTSVTLPEGLVVEDAFPRTRFNHFRGCGRTQAIARKAEAGGTLCEGEIGQLFNARGDDFSAVCQAADRLRAAVSGNRVGYIVNRNINYTNICTYRCNFCAFAKGRKRTQASDAPYLKSAQEVARLAEDAWRRGATEVCLQGGIHPHFTGQSYLDICSAVHAVLPEMHIHAFSPLEVMHGAQSLGLPVRDFLKQLQQVGLKTLPGTAAEILSDDVRAIICPDKLRTDEWLEVVATAHELGLSTTATIMFGHVDHYRHWAIHLQRILELQLRTGGITEFVPLPFVAAEAPIFRRGQSRQGPTFREAVLMHAVSRLVLSPAIQNIQTSWVKMGLDGARVCLQAGANDIGGTLMNESITRAAGAIHGQEMSAATLENTIRSCGRQPYQRTTMYTSAIGRDVIPQVQALNV